MHPQSLAIVAVLATGCRSDEATPHTGADARKVVDCGGSGDYATLGAAIGAAADGDVIDVLPCTYTEAIDFGGRTVRLQSTAGAATTIIDAGGVGPVVTAEQGEGDGTALVGFTLTGGVETFNGGGVFVDLSRLRLEDVVVTGNSGDSIVHSHAGDVELANVRISGNTVGSTGAALRTFRGAVNATGLDVDCDGGADAAEIGHGSALIDYSSLRCPTATAMHWIHATGRLQRTRTDGAVAVVNEAGASHLADVVTMENDAIGGDLYVSDGTATLRNSVVLGVFTMVAVTNPIVTANVFEHGSCGINADAATTNLAPEYNDFWDVIEESCDTTVWSGTAGNLAVDPMFTDEAAGDFTLLPASALRNAGLPGNGFDDVDGSRNDIGLHGGPKNISGGW